MARSPRSRCRLCGKKRVLVGALKGIGKICKECSSRSDPSFRFQQHIGKCWDFKDGDIVMRPKPCTSCMLYDLELGNNRPNE